MPTAESDLFGRLSICGLTELQNFEAEGVTHVISILDPETPEPEDLAKLGPHKRLSLRLHDIIEPEEGQIAPSRALIKALLEFGAAYDADPTIGKHLLIHCQLGVSRSTAAMAILLARDGTRKADEIFKILLGIRSRAWPNSWMIRLADEHLQKNGQFRAALDDHYRHQTIHRPEIVAAIRRIGRGAEIPESET